MRLIDADKLFKELFVHDQKLCPNRDVDNFPITVKVEDVKKAIKNQPTAYDVNVVVEQLEEEKEKVGFVKATTEASAYIRGINDAIKIVKGCV